MGWNSFDCYGSAVTEAQVRANAEFMARHLRGFGWEYIVVDISWYDPLTGAPTTLDEFGRLLPAPNRFPSAANGVGFKPLADFVHGLGLKFGIHLLRGIPREAVTRNTPIRGTHSRASDVANRADTCSWCFDMFGVRLEHPAAQVWYDSLIGLFADWGVDLLKIDDLGAVTAPPPAAGSRYPAADIEAYAQAIQRTRRPIVLSLSPGNHVSTESAEHRIDHCEAWRITGDVWDNWPDVVQSMAALRAWQPWIGPGHWPDGDMLPLGRLSVDARDHGADRHSKLTRDEQLSVINQWCIARSPLMMGGDLPGSDEFTLSLLTNADALAVNQQSTGNCVLFERGPVFAWAADVPDSPDKYFALFNTGDTPVPFTVPAVDLGLPLTATARDVWRGSPPATLPPHASALCRVSPNVPHFPIHQP